MVIHLFIISLKSPTFDIIQAFYLSNMLQQLNLFIDAYHFIGQLEVLAFLIESYPESITAGNNHGHLPLHDACWHEALLKVLTFFIKSCPESIKIADNMIIYHYIGYGAAIRPHWRH